MPRYTQPSSPRPLQWCFPLTITRPLMIPPRWRYERWAAGPPSRHAYAHSFVRFGARAVFSGPRSAWFRPSHAGV
eukprot:10234566-Lingulodinium_polyedra.AAC.1